MVEPQVSVVYRPGEFVLPAKYQGKVPEGRLASTPGDNIAELAGKECYSTFDCHPTGGRPSAEYHTHIRESGHYSVYAHAVETFSLDAGSIGDSHEPSILHHLTALVGRPGVWITSVGNDGIIRFSISLRAVLEWNNHGVASIQPHGRQILAGMLLHLRPLFPLTLQGIETPHVTRAADVVRALPICPQERWASLYMEGITRDLLQELCRHHYQTNPSVRSTRYVDEGGSNQVLHPALVGTDLEDDVNVHFDTAKERYREVFRALTAKGVDKKTARGAARSLLPGATETRLVYSLSEFQAKHILALRADQSTGSADPEIVRLAGMMRTVLRAEGWDV